MWYQEEALYINTYITNSHMTNKNKASFTWNLFMNSLSSNQKNHKTELSTKHTPNPDAHRI